MTFRNAGISDRDTINRLYQSVKGTKYCVWDEDYPGEREINEDLSADNLFVLEDGSELLGAISINSVNELDDWDGWKIRGKAGEFARVVIRPEQQGRGLSEVLVKGVLSELEKRDIHAVHISVAKSNIPAQGLYRKLGFDFVGERFMYEIDFYLCELAID